MTKKIVNRYFIKPLLSIVSVFKLKNIGGKWKKT